jgi:hypothetical protein
VVKALKNLVADQQIVYLYKPHREDEYGLGFYRAGKVAAINSPGQMVDLTGNAKEIFCITDNKTLDEVAHIAKVEMKVMQTLGNQTAFLAWRSK